MRTALAMVATMAVAIAVLTLVGASPAAAAGGTASSSLATFSGTTAAMTDGNLGTSWKSSGAPAAHSAADPNSGDWVRLDKGAVVPVSRVDLFMTAAASPADRIEVGFIEISADGSNWTWLGTFSNTNEVHIAAPAGTTARYVRAKANVFQTTWIAVREFSTVSTGVAPPTPPAQPATGPGGSAVYPYTGAATTSDGANPETNASWYAFEPTGGPALTSAPVAIVLHGYGEYSGFNSMFGVIAHTVRMGYIVIYPRWQTNLASPLDIAGRMTAAKNGITGALGVLNGPGHVHPDLTKINYLGWSYGGIIATNLANRDNGPTLPKPKSLMLIEPHDGFFENDLDATLTGIPASTYLTCYVSDDVRANDNIGCKTIFPRVSAIPVGKKDYVTYYDDTRGSPGLTASHQSVCSMLFPVASDACGGANATPDMLRTDAMDFALLRSWIAQQRCANTGADCPYAINDTPQHRDMGTWSDGVPVRPMRVGDAPAAP